MYLKEKPTEGIEMIRSDHRHKNRAVIPDHQLLNLHNFLSEENPHYLLACHILYYTFIRPKEMSHLKICMLKLRKECILLGMSVC